MSEAHSEALDHLERAGLALGPADPHGDNNLARWLIGLAMHELARLAALQHKPAESRSGGER